MRFAGGKFSNRAEEEYPTPQFAFDAVVRRCPPIFVFAAQASSVKMRSRAAGFVGDGAGRRFRINTG